VNSLERVAAANHGVRAAFQSLVVGAALEELPGATVKGSFRYGDFHLRVADQTTLSDLDLILSTATDENRHQAARMVHRHIMATTGIEIRVSVQPEDHHDALNLSDARLLVIGEYLRHAPTIASDWPAYDYLLAKSCLGVLRTKPTQRPNQVTAEVGTGAARAALRMRLGSSDAFPAAGAATLLEQGPESAERDMLARLVGKSPTRVQSEDFLSELASRPEIHPWLVSLFERLVSAPWK
jgi:hypothetical protein